MTNRAFAIFHSGDTTAELDTGYIVTDGSDFIRTVDEIGKATVFTIEEAAELIGDYFKADEPGLHRLEIVRV